MRLGTFMMLLGLVVLLLPPSTPVMADQLSDGIAAYEQNDYATALRLLRPLADKGDATAQVALGFMYLNGWGVPQDPDQAVRRFRRAADQGSATAQTVLGHIYFLGAGVSQDNQEALNWYRRAASQGDASAQYAVGGMYEDGRGVKRDFAQALKWHLKAAQEGYPPAQDELGMMFWSGRFGDLSLPQDDAVALEWFRKSAEQGEASAQFHVGAAYRDGRGVQRSYEEALKWFRLAGETNGFALAQCALGDLYTEGSGVAKDDAESANWYRKAAEQGYDCEKAQASVQPEIVKRNPIGWSEVIRVSDTFGPSMMPSASSGPDGQIHLVWMASSNGNFDVYYSAWNGSDWSPPTNVSKSSGKSLFPSVALTRFGEVQIVWMEQTEKGWQIAFSRLRNGQWIPSVAISKPAKMAQRPKLAIDSTGVTHVMWFQNSDDHFELWEARFSGERWSGAVDTHLFRWLVTDNPGYTLSPALVANSDGSLTAAWTDLSDDYNIHLVTSRFHSGVWERPVTASTEPGDPEEVAMAVGLGSDLYLAWYFRGSIWFARSTDSGGNWSVAKRLFDNGAMPGIAYHGGHILLAWTDQTKNQVLYSVSAGQEWSAPLDVSQSTGHAVAPVLAVDGRNVLHVIWMDSRQGEMEIMDRQFVAAASSKP